MRPNTPPKTFVINTNVPAMLHFLLEKLPAEIVTEIALFEGRILRAYLRDYLSQLYVNVYKRYFGYRYTLRTICGGLNHVTPKNIPVPDTMGSLPFYTTWSTAIRLSHPEFVKSRKSRKHMRDYVGLVPEQALIRARLDIEQELAHYMCYSTGSILAKLGRAV